MDEIKVNEKMTELAMAAHNIAKLKQDDPEVYKMIMSRVINDNRRLLESKLEDQDKFTAMFSKSVMEAIFKRLYDNPFTLIEIGQMVQEIDHKKKEDKES